MKKPVKSPGLDGLPPSVEGRRIEPYLAIAAGALLLVLAFFLGRFSVGEPALAADNATLDSPTADFALDLDRSPESPQDLPQPLPKQQPKSSNNSSNNDAADDHRSAADRAFFLPSNRVTVCAQSYGKEEQSRWEADYYALLDIGLPVVHPVPDRGGKWIVLCVGAEPNKNSEIDRILETLHAMPNFASAYVNNIDNVFKR